MPCDWCGAANATIVVTAKFGIDVWNHIHADDQRTELRFCSERCCYACGVSHGRTMRAAAESA